jgi:hypothetical protein
MSASGAAKAKGRSTQGRAHVPRTARARSRVTNGATTFIEKIDQRSAPARRFVDVLQAFISDLGGRDDMSEAQYQVAKRCAALTVKCEMDEALMVAGEPVNMDAFGRNVSRLGRELQRLGFKGLRRRPKDVTPSVRQYAARAREQQEAQQ